MAGETQEDGVADRSEHPEREAVDLVDVRDDTVLNPLVGDDPREPPLVTPPDRRPDDVEPTGAPGSAAADGVDLVTPIEAAAPTGDAPVDQSALGPDVLAASPHDDAHPEPAAPEPMPDPVVPDRSPRGLALFAVVALGLGVGYLAATLIGGGATWLRDLSWLAAGSAMLVGVLCLVWLVRPSSRRWTSGVLAGCAWLFTVVAAVSLGLVAMLSQGALDAPGVAAGNAFLAAVTCWFGAWLLSRLDFHRVRRQVRSWQGGLSGYDDRLAALEEQVARATERLADLDDRVEQATEHQETLLEVAADWERATRSESRVDVARAEAPAYWRARPRALWRRDR